MCLQLQCYLPAISRVRKLHLIINNINMSTYDSVINGMNIIHIQYQTHQSNTVDHNNSLQLYKGRYIQYSHCS